MFAYGWPLNPASPPAPPTPFTTPHPWQVATERGDIHWALNKEGVAEVELPALLPAEERERWFGEVTQVKQRKDRLQKELASVDAQDTLEMQLEATEVRRMNGELDSLNLDLVTAQQKVKLLRCSHPAQTRPTRPHPALPRPHQSRPASPNPSCLYPIPLHCAPVIFATPFRPAH